MAKKLLLLEDVEYLGRKGDLVNAKNGFAYNYLIPQGFALVASESTLRRQVKLQEERKKLAENDRKESEELAARLNGESLTFLVKVDHEGHMYGSVSALDIVNLIKLQTGIDLDKRFVVLKHPIKETGIFDVTLRLKEEIFALIHVKIIPEQHAHEA
jgi:large subunit ribosomal protein L9